MTTNLHDKMLAAIDAYFSASDRTEEEVAENLLLDVRDEINKQQSKAQPAPVQEPVAQALSRDAVLANIAGWLRHLADDVTIPYFTNGAFKADCNEAADVLLESAPPAAPVQETVSGYIKKIEDLIQERDDARSSRDFYKRRADALQEWQSKMRDPERTIVCDILANGCTLEPAGDRYTTPPAQPAPVQEPVKFLANGTRFKTSEFPYGVCINGLPKELSGCWVALVAAEDDCHLKLTAPPAPQPVPVKTYHDGKPWPVAPKPWVGLTDEEVAEGLRKPFWEDAARAIEAKLKEKNT